MKHHHLPLMLCSLVLAGCAAQFLPTSTSDGSATLTLQPRVTAGGLRSVANTISPYGQSDIDHALVRLYTVSNGSESALIRGGSYVQADVASGSLGAPLSFNGLHANTTYRVRAFAYKASGTADGDLISTGDSYADIAVGTNDRPALGTLPVRLMDRLFNGEGTASIVIYPGGLENGPESLTASFTPAPPSPSVPAFNGTIVSTLTGHNGGGDAVGSPSQAQFDNPTGIDVDAQGNLYVGDSYNRRVCKITPAGVVSTLFQSIEPNDTFVDVVVAPGGVVYALANAGLGNLYKIPTSGSPTVIRSIGTGSSVATALALGADGYLYVTDANFGKVYRMNTDGGDFSTFASGLSAPYEIVARPAGGFYVCELGIGRVSIVASGSVTPFVAFPRAQNLTLDAAGNIYLNSDMESRIYKIDADTKNITLVAGLGASEYSDGDALTEADFSYPYGLAFSPDFSILYVVETLENAIRKIQ